jgi:Zn-dependent membrane protease YugP
MFFGFDWQHLLYVGLPMMALMGLCQLWVMLAYAKWSQVNNHKGITGAEAAMILLKNADIHDVRVEQVDGWLSDHYAPTEKVLRLSPRNYSGTSIAAVGIAAHEAGHAIQHARAFAPLAIRNLAVPLASIGSQFGYLALVIGFFVMSNKVNFLTLTGLAMLGFVVLFQLVNLPVEFDASRRALALLPGIGVLDAEETAGARKVLTAAAMTYVAATVAALWELLFWAMRLGLIGGGRSSDD